MSVAYMLVQYNFITVTMTIALITYIMLNSSLEKKTNRLFISACLVLFVLIVIDSLEVWMQTFDYYVRGYVLVSVIGYICRPLILVIIMMIVLRDTKIKKTLLFLPLIFNTVIEISALFGDWVFTYDAHNQLVRGPFAYTPHIVGSLYLVYIFILTMGFFREKNAREGVVVLLLAILCAVATALESLFHFEILNATIIMDLTFYYLYFHMQNAKRDQLTKSFDRKAFYRDCEKYAKDICAVITIDLNNLKTINDTQGHAAGDEAIITMVECIRRVEMKKSNLYRTGGDEFCILCCVDSQEMIRSYIQRIKSEMSKTPYSCAIGVAYNTELESIEELCIRSDKAMYEDKRMMKEAIL